MSLKVFFLKELFVMRGVDFFLFIDSLTSVLPPTFTAISFRT